MENDNFNSLDGAIEYAVSFNILQLMPSGPDAFDVSRLFKISSVSACDMFMEANLEFVLYTISGRLALEVSIVANCKRHG